MFLFCVLLIHISGPKTEKDFFFFKCSSKRPEEKHQWENNSLNKFYQRRLVIAMKYNDEICDGQHTYNRKQIKKTRHMLNQNYFQDICSNNNECLWISYLNIITFLYYYYYTISEFESSKIFQCFWIKSLLNAFTVTDKFNVEKIQLIPNPKNCCVHNL